PPMRPSLPYTTLFRSLGRRADVDLEHLLHGTLQSVLEAAEPCGPGLGVLAHPAVVDEADGDRVQVVELLPSPPLRDHQARLLEQDRKSTRLNSSHQII